MSVIHEALKKVGEPIMRQPRTTPQARQKKGPAGRRFLTVSAVFLTVVGSFFFGFLLNHGHETGSSNALGQFGIEETSLPASPPAPFFLTPQSSRNINRAPFVLSGIAQSGADFYCLINGLVLRRGQKVGEATVESITLDRVTLDHHGKKIELTA